MTCWAMKFPPCRGLSIDRAVAEDLAAHYRAIDLISYLHRRWLAILAQAFWCWFGICVYASCAMPNWCAVLMALPTVGGALRLRKYCCQALLASAALDVGVPR